MSPEGNIGSDLGPGDAGEELIRSREMFTSCPAAQIPPLILPKYPKTQPCGSFWRGWMDARISCSPSSSISCREIRESAAIPCFAKPQPRAGRDFLKRGGENLNEEQPEIWGPSWRKWVPKGTKLGGVAVRGRLGNVSASQGKTLGKIWCGTREWGCFKGWINGIELKDPWG